MNKHRHPPIELTEKLNLRKTVAQAWLVEETMHSKQVTVILLRGKKPSRLLIEGNHIAQFYSRINQDIVIHFEWGHIQWVITPATNYLWHTEKQNEWQEKEKAKYSTHWCNKPSTCSHWSHLFDQDMRKPEIDLCLQEIANSHNKLTLSDIASGIVIHSGKKAWKSWAAGPVASFYIHAPEDTGEEYRYFLLNCIQGLPTRHPHWLDSLVMTSTYGGRIVFGLPTEGSLRTTLREFLATQNIA